MKKENGFFVFTRLSSERFVKIHRDTCGRAHLKENHPDRAESWHWFQTYQEARQYAIQPGRDFKKSGLDCSICCPSAD